MLSVKELSFSYPQKKVLNKITFSLREGDFCALIGPNGSGKTTLMRTMLGLLKVPPASIMLEGKALTNYSPKALATKIAYVAQRQDIVFDFSVFDTVMMGRNPHQHSWEMETEHDRKVVEETLYQTRTWELRNCMLSQLSGGEYQRVMIARAMAQQTKIIFLDEPLSNLDVVIQYEIMDILQTLNKKKHTTIFIILHDLSFVKKYATSTLLIKNGTIHAYGSTNQVLTEANVRQVFDMNENYFLDERGHVERYESSLPKL